MKRQFITPIIFTALLILLAGAGLAAPMLGVTNFDSIHLNDSNGTATPNFLANQRGSGAIAEFRDNGTPVARIPDGGGLQILSGTLDIDGGLSIANRSLFLRYQDVAAAPSIRAAATVIATVTAVDTAILGIETPRNAVITYVSSVSTTATAGNITVAGIDARGNSTTEQIAVAAQAGSQTLTGVVPWVSITSLTLPTRTEVVTVTVTGGQLFGLPLVPNAASDVYHLTVALTPVVPTVNTTYGTFNPVATPAANVDYNVWVKQ